MSEDFWRKTTVKRGLEAISDLLPVIAGRGYVAGSYAAYMASPMDAPIRPNDIDVFATSELNFNGISTTLIDNGWRFSECTSISNGFEHAERQWPVQVILPNSEWKDFPDDILKSFDFDVCRALYVPDENKVLADLNAGIKQAKVLRIRDPLRSLKRAVKYQARGVTFSDHELLKLFQAWEQMEPGRKKDMLDNARIADEPCDSGSFSWDGSDYYEGE